ncbi:hypothetical protein V2J09_016613 [Rumex salicifolius]
MDTWNYIMHLIPSFIIWILVSLVTVDAIPSPRGYLLNCGSSADLQTETLKYVADNPYTKTGNATTVKIANAVPLLSTLRYFPDKSFRRHCYSFPVVRGSKHLIRTTYFYGGFDGGDSPPVFEQFVDGARWCTVNTTEDYAAGRSSYYELVVAALGDKLAVCLGRSKDTRPESSPFISGLEVMLLDALVYKPVDFGRYMLATVARHSFGNVSDEFISFPDDNFNRLWESYKVSSPIVYCKSHVTPSDFWNIPPARVFSTALTNSRGKSLELSWPAAAVPTGKYYVALYFQDNRSPSPYSWRVFNVTINGNIFSSGLNVSAKGVAVYGDQWPLSGPTRIVLTPLDGIPVGPVINAAEMLQILPAAARTIPRDVMALEGMTKNISNLPSDWVGDPCLPQRFSWTGVVCSDLQLRISVTTLNLTGMGLTGTLPPSITNLSDITNLYAHNQTHSHFLHFIHRLGCF